VAIVGGRENNLPKELILPANIPFPFPQVKITVFLTGYGNFMKLV
jgi:hypothetical protein